jgi:formamidopyrimidine-DNA glycosylase
MPELPDVESFRRYLDATALHQAVTEVQVLDQSVLDDVSPQRLTRALKGARMNATRRWGKHLLVDLDTGQHLTLHFGMTGFLKYYQNPDQAPEHPRVLFHLENDYTLAYDCQRMLGRVGLVDRAEDLVDKHDLGPDVMTLDFEAFKNLLAGRRGTLKSALMNQNLISGIGNVYSDEILFQLGLHPKTRLKDLGEDDLRRVHDMLHRVVDAAVNVQADPERMPSNWLTPNREPGGRCPRPGCGGEIERVTVSGRSAYYCPACQS